ncbi:MAG: class I SAM-dependent methyltransferase [Thermoleophilaceae bacterium]
MTEPLAATPAASGFDGALAAVRDVEGWLSDDQARVLWERARSVPPGGQIVEIGSYRGRSAIVMARAAAGATSVVAIDPHAGDDRGPQQIRGSAEEGAADNQAFVANLERAGVAGHVRHVRLPSAEALHEVGGAIDLLYVDGAHRLGPARDDIVRWGARVRPGGTLLIHDAFSSIGVTLALATTLFTGRDFAYVGRTRSLAEYRRVAAPLRLVERATGAARQAAELPWFARNVLVKVALVLRLRPVARLLGHRSGDWPY